MNYTVVKELKATAKYNKYIELKDLMFLMSYVLFAYLLNSYVYSSLRVAYYIFSLLCAIFLIMKMPANPTRKNYQRVLIMLQKDWKTYKPIKNESVREEMK